MLGREHAVIVGVAGQRGEDLLAVDDPAALDRAGLRLEGGAAGRRGAAFREGLRIDRAVGDDAAVVQRAPALVRGAGRSIHVEVVGERARPQGRADMHVPGQRRRAAVAPDLGGADRIGAVAGAEPALPFRDADGEEAGLVQVAIVLGREAGLAVVDRGALGEDRLAHGTRLRGERGLLVAQAEGSGIEQRRIEAHAVETELGDADMGGHAVRFLLVIPDAAKRLSGIHGPVPPGGSRVCASLRPGRRR